MYGICTHTRHTEAQASLAVKLQFIGYCIQSKGYRSLYEKLSQVYVRRDVIKTLDIKQRQFLPVIHLKRLRYTQNMKLIQNQRSRVNQNKRDNRNTLNDLQSRYGIDEHADITVASAQHVAYNAHLNHKLWMKLWPEMCQTNGSTQQTLNMTHSCRMKRGTL